MPAGAPIGSEKWHEQKAGGYGIFTKGPTKNHYAAIEGVRDDLDEQLAQFAGTPGFPTAIKQLKALPRESKETQRTMANALNVKHPERTTGSWKAVLTKIKTGAAQRVPEMVLKAAKLHVMQMHKQKCGVCRPLLFAARR